MFLIEILLPLYDNEGHSFGQALFDEVRDELAGHFGGVTAFRRSPAEGVWREGDETNHDEVVIYEVMTGELDRAWWGHYRQDLEDRFRQDQIVIRASQFETL